MTPLQAAAAARALRYDYTNQAWIRDDKYVACNHPAAMDCRCYGKIHAGETAPPVGDNVMRWPSFGEDWR